MKVKIFIVYLLMALWVPKTSFAQNETEEPNIIIFFTDDQGYADVGVFGAEGFETPNLDELASQGVRFTNFYVPATVCTPSRAALLTGKYPIRTGLHNGVISPYSTHGLDPKEITLAEMLKEQGYATSCIGKWHLGHEDKFMPNNQGFDEFYGVPYSNDMDNYYYKNNDFQSPPLPFYRNDKIIGKGLDQRYLTKMYTEEAVHRIEKNSKDKPFFIYLAHTMPHEPLYSSEKFKGKSTLGIYGDVIMEIDWSMGQIVEALKKEGVFNNTIIIFTSDNGPRVGSAKPLRGFKAETWEGGQRVPAIISWPNVIPKNIVSEEVISTLDLYPTLAKISGAKIEELNIMDGIDLSEHLSNPSTVHLDKKPFYYFARNGDLEAVRFGKWKLHLAKSKGWNKKKNDIFEPALYDLNNDVSENINLATDNPDIVQKLTLMLQEFEITVQK